MNLAQLAKGERLPEEVVGVGAVRIPGAQVSDGQTDDVLVVIGEPAGAGGRRQPSRIGKPVREPLDGHGGDMSYRQHPAAVVAAGSVEHVELPGLKAAHIGLGAQRPAHGAGQGLPRVQEGSGQRPARALLAAHLQHQ